MSAQKNYPWRITFSDGSSFELSDTNRDDLLAKIRDAATLAKDEVKIEVSGRLVQFCDHIYGNQDGGRISAILIAALPTTWQGYNMSYGTLEMGKFGSGLKLIKLDYK